MKFKATLLALLTVSTTALAQTDPFIMTINGKNIPRSEFEYSFNKNNSDGVIDKKSVDEYVDLFINYKLKVEAALDAHLDTVKAFQTEFRSYRDQQIRPSFVEDEDLEREARKVYENTKNSIGPAGLIRPAHIFLHVGQKESEARQKEVKQRADSIYQALKSGADFAEMAQKFSEDKGSAANGGLLPFIGPKQTVKEFEEAAYALQVGEMSAPVLSSLGYHIILMKERKQLDPYDSLRTNIMRFIEQRGIREHIADEKINAMVKESGGTETKESIMDKRAAAMQAADPDLDNLVKEYYDGLLLYEISNQKVWEKGSKDEKGLQKFFKKNKKKYAWDTPRFKGMVYHVKEASDVEAVKNSVKKIPFDKWGETLRKTFNSDSIIRIRVEKGIFKAGDNAFVDKLVFNKDTTTTAVKGYPIDAQYGKILKDGPEDYTDVRGLVTADYQDMLEKEWVATLRKKYKFYVDKDVLKTVNNH